MRPVQALRLDGQLHHVALEQAEVFAIHLTPAAIHAVGIMEQSLTGTTDPVSMLAHRGQPRIKGLRRIPGREIWIIGYNFSGFGRDAATRYREIDAQAGRAVVLALGYSIGPGVADPDGVGPGIVLSTAALAIASAYDLHVDGQRVSVAAVARRAGLSRTSLYRNPDAVRFIRMMVNRDVDAKFTGFYDSRGNLEVYSPDVRTREDHFGSDATIFSDDDLIHELKYAIYGTGLEPVTKDGSIHFRFLGRMRKISVEDVQPE